MKYGCFFYIIWIFVLEGGKIREIFIGVVVIKNVKEIERRMVVNFLLLLDDL